MMDVKEQLKLEKRVFKFVHGYSNRKLEDLTLDTRLNHDLKIDGRYAIWMLMFFSTKFDVDMKSIFADNNFEGHFSYYAKSEPAMRFYPMLYHFFWARFSPFLNLFAPKLFVEDRMIPVTIEDLVFAAKHKTFPDLSTRAYEKRED